MKNVACLHELAEHQSKLLGKVLLIPICLVLAFGAYDQYLLAIPLELTLSLNSFLDQKASGRSVLHIRAEANVGTVCVNQQAAALANHQRTYSGTPR